MHHRHQLSISVSTSRLEGTPPESFDWGSVSIGTEEQDLSIDVFGEAHVYSILIRAFSAGLARNVAWDLSRVEPNFLNSFLIAGKIFKRGVFFIGGAETKQSIAQDDAHAYQVNQVNELGQCFAKLRDGDLIIVDQGVADYWRLQIPGKYLVFKFSEAEKNLASVEKIIDVLRNRQSRSSRIFIVGGGVAGDVVGFAAGILGLRCHYVPTTLLAMVDSSIGGKVGVNFESWGKNQIGLFRSPVEVSVWSGWLTTLAAEQLRSGLVEALKHALLGGQPRLWRRLIAAATLTQVDFGPISSELINILSIKKAVIDRDPFERGERAVLNFGHTLGHVLETFATTRGRSVTHGECVAIGMIHALRLSARHSGMQGTESLITDLRVVCPSVQRMKEVFWEAEGLPMVKQEILNLLLADKKSSAGSIPGTKGGEVNYVLLTAPGSVARSFDGAWTMATDIESAWEGIVETWNFLESKLSAP